MIIDYIKKIIKDSHQAETDTTRDAFLSACWSEKFQSNGKLRAKL